MPLVKVETVVHGPPEAAYVLAKDMESYPQFMKDVVSLRVVGREANAQVTDWHVNMQGRPVHWQERDEFDDQRHVITYRQTAGDLRKFEGEWRFLPEGGATRITLTIDFEFGLPMLSALLNPVGRLVARRNAESMLAAIKARVEAAGARGPLAGPDGGGEGGTAVAGTR